MPKEWDLKRTKWVTTEDGPLTVEDYINGGSRLLPRLSPGYACAVHAAALLVHSSDSSKATSSKLTIDGKDMTCCGLPYLYEKNKKSMCIHIDSTNAAENNDSCMISFITECFYKDFWTKHGRKNWIVNCLEPRDMSIYKMGEGDDEPPLYTNPSWPPQGEGESRSRSKFILPLERPAVYEQMGNESVASAINAKIDSKNKREIAVNAIAMRLDSKIHSVAINGPIDWSGIEQTFVRRAIAEAIADHFFEQASSNPFSESIGWDISVITKAAVMADLCGWKDVRRAFVRTGWFNTIDKTMDHMVRVISSDIDGIGSPSVFWRWAEGVRQTEDTSTFLATMIDANRRGMVPSVPEKSPPARSLDRAGSRDIAWAMQHGKMSRSLKNPGMYRSIAALAVDLAMVRIGKDHYSMTNLGSCSFKGGDSECRFRRRELARIFGGGVASAELIVECSRFILEATVGASEISYLNDEIVRLVFGCSFTGILVRQDIMPR